MQTILSHLWARGAKALALNKRALLSSCPVWPGRFIDNKAVPCANVHPKYRH